MAKLELRGGPGNDRLDGGLGDDTLIGNSGRDTFIVSRGNDTFVDFDPSRDDIDLGGRNIVDVDERNGNLILSIGGDEIVIIDTQAEDLNPNLINRLGIGDLIGDLI